MWILYLWCKLQDLHFLRWGDPSTRGSDCLSNQRSALSGSKAKGLALKRFSIYSALKTRFKRLKLHLKSCTSFQVASEEIEALSGLGFLPLQNVDDVRFNRPTEWVYVREPLTCSKRSNFRSRPSIPFPHFLSLSLPRPWRWATHACDWLLGAQRRWKGRGGHGDGRRGAVTDAGTPRRQRPV